MPHQVLCCQSVVNGASFALERPEVMEVLMNRIAQTLKSAMPAVVFGALTMLAPTAALAQRGGGGHGGGVSGHSFSGGGRSYAAPRGFATPRGYAPYAGRAYGGGGYNSGRFYAGRGYYYGGRFWARPYFGVGIGIPFGYGYSGPYGMPI